MRRSTGQQLRTKSGRCPANKHLINRWSTARRVPRFCLNRISFVSAFEYVDLQDGRLGWCGGRNRMSFAGRTARPAPVLSRRAPPPPPRPAAPPVLSHRDAPYTQFAIQDSRHFGPNPWKILTLPSNCLRIKYIFLGNPALGENLVTWMLAMRTGCTLPHPWDVRGWDSVGRLRVHIIST